MLRLCLIWLGCGLTCLASASVRADDLADLQGKWEMHITQDGVPARVVKTIEGRTETVEVYSNGMLVQKHHVEFELKSFGPAKVFIWRKGQIVAGPQTGQPLPDGRFIYRLEERTWMGVHGMLEGDRTGVLTEVYRRVGKRPDNETTAQFRPDRDE